MQDLPRGESKLFQLNQWIILQWREVLHQLTVNIELLLNNMSGYFFIST